MTLKQLIAEAKKIKGWRLLDGQVRCKVGDCPLLAVLRLHNSAMVRNNELDNSDYGTAARALRIRSGVAEKIVDAADDRCLWKDGVLHIRRLLIEELIPKSRRPKAAA